MRRLFLRLCVIPAILFALALPAFAQVEYVPADDVDALKELLRQGAAYRVFDNAAIAPMWTEAKADEVELRKVDWDEEVREIVLNGKTTDIAGVYVEMEGLWTNLAMALGIPVDLMPYVLPDKTDETAGSFPMTHFTGAMPGMKTGTLSLSCTKGFLFGEWSRGKDESPIIYAGTLAADGSFQIMETMDGESSAALDGKLDAATGALTGKREPINEGDVAELTFQRIAVRDGETYEKMINGQKVTGAIYFPKFTVLDPASKDSVNALIRKTALGRRDEFLAQAKDWLSEADEEGEKSEIDEDAPSSESEATEDPAATEEDSLSDESEERPYDFSIYAYQISEASPKFVSLMMTLYEYSGGDRANISFLTLNILITDDTSRLLAFDDIFPKTEDAVTALSKACITDLKKQEASSVVDGTTESFSKEEIEALTISKDAITVFFCPYAVGYYGEGEYTVRIPMAKAKGLLDPEVAAALE